MFNQGENGAQATKINFAEGVPDSLATNRKVRNPFAEPDFAKVVSDDSSKIYVVVRVALNSRKMNPELSFV